MEPLDIKPDSDGKATAKTITDIEDWVNEFALKYAQLNYSLPVSAFRIFLWPSDVICKLIPGPTARIIMGISPWHPLFNQTMRAVIDRVASQADVYGNMVVSRTAHVLDTDRQVRRWVKDRYETEADMIPDMLRDEDLIVKYITRVEVTHKKTGMREVVERDFGTTFAAKDIAKTRLARRVAEVTEEKDNTILFPVASA